MSSLKVVETKYSQYITYKENFHQEKDQLISLLHLVEVTLRHLGSKVNIKIHEQLTQKFMERFYPEINALFLTFYELTGCFKIFNGLYRAVISVCPIEVYNYGPSMLDTLFTIMKKNPVKYNESLGLCENLIATNIDNQFIKEWVR